MEKAFWSIKTFKTSQLVLILMPPSLQILICSKGAEMPPSHNGIALGLRPRPFGRPGSIPGGGV